MPDNLLGSNTSNEQFFLIPYKRIAKCEYIQILILIAIFIPCTIIIFGIKPFTFSLLRVYICLLDLGALGCLIVSIIRITYGKRRCPFEVYWDEAFLSFDDTQIALTDIQRIILTDKLAVSKSIFPRYRHLLVVTRQRKYRYWLGSEYGFRLPEYEDFCEKFERLCKKQKIELQYKA